MNAGRRSSLVNGCWVWLMAVLFFVGGNVQAQTNTMLDMCQKAAFTNNNGTTNWSGAWTEIGESNGAAAGYVRMGITDLSGSRMRIAYINRGARRQANLSDCSTAVLSFAYRRAALDGSTDYVTINVSSNGGTTWTELGRLKGAATDAAYRSTNYNIKAFASSNTQIRFQSSGTLGTADYVYFDNIQILFTQVGSPLAAAPTYAPDGGTYTNSVSVVLSSTTSSATVYYTTDGGTPTTNSASVASGSSIVLTQPYSGSVRALAQAANCRDSAISTSLAFSVVGGRASVPTNRGPFVFNREYGINYVHPLSLSHEFWDQYDHDTIERDLDLVVQLYRVKSNRIFVPYQRFGGQGPTGGMGLTSAQIEANFANLADYVSLNQKHGLKVTFTLFDSDFAAYCEYNPAYYEQNKAYIDSILGIYYTNPVTYIIDIKNELDNDYSTSPGHPNPDYSPTNVLSWAREMATHIQANYPNVPVTASHSGASKEDRPMGSFTNSLDWMDVVSVFFDGNVEPTFFQYANMIYGATPKSVIFMEYTMHSDTNWNKDERAQAQWVKEVTAYMDARQLPERPFPSQYWTLNDLSPEANAGGLSGYERHMGLVRYPDQSTKPVGVFMRHRNTTSPAWEENFNSTNGWDGSSPCAVPDGLGGVRIPHALALADTNRYIQLKNDYRQELALVCYPSDLYSTTNAHFFTQGEGPDFALNMVQYDTNKAAISTEPICVVDSQYRNDHSLVWFVDLNGFNWNPSAVYLRPVFTITSTNPATTLTVDLLRVDEYDQDATNTIPWDTLADCSRWNYTDWGGNNAFTSLGNGTARLLMTGAEGWGQNDTDLRFPAEIVEYVAADVHAIALPGSYGLFLRCWSTNMQFVNFMKLYEYYQFSGYRRVDLTNINWGASNVYWIAPRIAYAGGPGEIVFNAMDIGFKEGSLIKATTGTAVYVIRQNMKHRFYSAGDISSYGYDASKAIAMEGVALDSIPTGSDIEPAAFADLFNPMASGWRDASVAPDFNAFLRDNSNGTASISIPGECTWGKVLSRALVNVNVDLYPILDVKLGKVDPGTILEFSIQQEEDPWTLYKVISGKYGPGQYSLDIRPFTGWSGYKTFSIEARIIGAGKTGVLDHVMLRQVSDPRTAFRDTFAAVQPGWRDESVVPGFNATLQVNGDETATLSLPSDKTWGKVLSEVLVDGNVSDYPLLAVDVAGMDEGAKLGISIQQEEGAWARYVVWTNIYGPGQYVADIRPYTGWSGPQTFSIELLVEGAGKSAVLNSVELLPGDVRTDPFEEEFDPPRFWRDVSYDSGYQAKITDLKDGTIRITKPVGVTWGKILSETIHYDLSTFKWLDVAVDHVQEDCYLEVNIQMEEDGNWQRYPIMGSITNSGHYSANLQNYGLTGTHAFSFEVVLVGPSSAKQSIAHIGYIGLLDE